MDSLADLDPAALLAAEEAGVSARRQGDVDSLLRLLAWCDQHTVDPQTQPDATPIRQGGDRLIRLGGEGTPEVSQLCMAEFAVAAHAGEIATSNRAADALDLRHRLPAFWALVQDGRVEVWVARKIASLSRKLTAKAVALVDASAAAGVDLTPGKLIELAEARIIEADPAAHRERIAADEARTGVWKQRRRPGQAVADVDGQADVQGITVRLSTAGAMELTTTVDEIADLLADQHVPKTNADGVVEDLPTMDQFRAQAMELLADPYAVIRLLEGAHPTQEPTDEKPAPAEGPADEPAPQPAPAPEPEPAPSGKRGRVERKAIIHVHISAAALLAYGLSDNPDTTGVARVEGLGPILYEQLAALLRNRTSIELKPVIDLNLGHTVDSYEHPIAVKERTILRTGGDVFPHTTSRSRRLDHDHPTPYEKNGPPGQTGDHNDAPLTRRHHRAKTHLPYRVTQFGHGAYRWETPHGLVRLITRHGTTTVQALRDHDGTLIGEIYPERIPITYDVA